MTLAILAITWVIGLLLAGSDSGLMPGANLFGLFLFFVASIGIGRLLTIKRREHIYYD